MKQAFAVVLLTCFAAACGNTSSMGPTGPTAQTAMTGTWAGRRPEAKEGCGLQLPIYLHRINTFPFNPEKSTLATPRGHRFA